LTGKRALLVFTGPLNPPARSSAALPQLGALFASEVAIVSHQVTGRAPGRTTPELHVSFPAEWTELVAEWTGQPDDYRLAKQKDVGRVIGNIIA